MMRMRPDIDTVRLDAMIERDELRIIKSSERVLRMPAGPPPHPARPAGDGARVPPAPSRPSPTRGVRNG
jgi:hypothetical protein